MTLYRYEGVVANVPRQVSAKAARNYSCTWIPTVDATFHVDHRSERKPCYYRVPSEYVVRYISSINAFSLTSSRISKPCSCVT